MIIFWPIYKYETEEEREVRLAMTPSLTDPGTFKIVMIGLGIVLLAESFFIYNGVATYYEQKAQYEARMAEMDERREDWREYFKEWDFYRRHDCAMFCWDWPKDKDIPGLIRGEQDGSL